MRTRLILRRALLPVTVLLLVGLAWWALAGAIRQIPISHTADQRIETAVQCICGVLTLLVVLTRFVLNPGRSEKQGIIRGLDHGSFGWRQPDMEMGTTSNPKPA